MSRNISNGSWFNIKTEAEHKQLKAYGSLTTAYSQSRVQMGTFEGPGRYYLLSYSQRCPRGCCYDDVHELLSASDTAIEVREAMRDLAYILKSSRQEG